MCVCGTSRKKYLTPNDGGGKKCDSFIINDFFYCLSFILIDQETQMTWSSSFFLDSDSRINQKKPSINFFSFDPLKNFQGVCSNQLFSEDYIFVQLTIFLLLLFCSVLDKSWERQIFFFLLSFIQFSIIVFFLWSSSSLWKCCLLVIWIWTHIRDKESWKNGILVFFSFRCFVE